MLLFGSALVRAQSGDESVVAAIVQKLFDGMAAHNAVMMQSSMLPDARLYSARNDAPPTSTAGDEFLSHVLGMKNDLLERFTEPAKVLVQGRIAQVWGNYEFLLDGKFVHCGVDSFSLLKTAQGWKIASVAYTAQSGGCLGH